MPDRPDPIVVGLLTVHAERAPTRRHAAWWWRGYITRDGRREKPVFGRGTVAEIQAAAMRWMLGERPAEAEPDARTVRDACETWLGRKTAEHDAGQIAPASLAAYTASVRRLISRKREGTIGDVRLVDLDEDRVELYALARAAAGHGTKTINDDVSVLLMALRRARRKGWSAPELAPKPLKRVPKRPVRTPTREEILRVMAALPPRYRLLLWLQYATGARIGEIAHIEWADLDLDAGTVALGRHLGARKTGERVVTLADEVLVELRAWRDRPPEHHRGVAPPAAIRDRWVLGVAPVTAISRQMKLLRTACAGMDRFTSHAIRRWAVDEAGRAGMELAAAASQFGHSPAEMMRTYRRPDLDDRRKVVAGAQLGAVLPFRR